MPVNLRDNIKTNFRQFGLSVRNLGVTIRDSVQSNVIVDNLKGIQNTVTANVKGFQENIKNNFENSRNPAFQGKGATRRWSKQYDYGAVFEIHSVQKLLDIIERRYSYVSITLLLISTAFESTAVAFFLKAQFFTSLENWRHFVWGTPNFVILSVLSIFFALSWLALLSSTHNKIAYLCKPTSIMTYATSFTMLFFAIAAVVTQDKGWTTMYVPMFFRSWWLHECLLALLDYPQISAFFTENKLEMVRSFIQCMAVISISVGLLQAVEMFCGDHMEFFNTFYMMMIVFSTIGYGDVTVNTVPGLLLLIVLIGVGISYFVPMLEYIANLGVEHLRYARYATWFKRVNHVIFAGSFSHNDLRMQLENLFAGKRCYLNTHVVVLIPNQPSAEILLLLNAPKYRSSVTLLVGDPGNTNDLVRCNARGASGIFLFGGGANTSYYDDYDVARQAMCVHEHVPHMPLYVLLHRSRYTRSIMPKTAHIIEVERLNHNLLGLGCVLPGIVPFIANLVRVFDPMASVQLWRDTDFDDPAQGTLAVAKAFAQIGSKQRDMYSYESLLSGAAQAVSLTGGTAEDVAIVREEIASFDPMWNDLYEASLAQHIEVLTLPENQRDRSFRSLALLMYKAGVTTIGVVRRVGSAKTRATAAASPRSGASSPTHLNNLSFASIHSTAPAAQFTNAAGAPGESVVELAPSGILSGVERVIVICDHKEVAQASLNALPPVASDNETQGFDGSETNQALKEHVAKHGGVASLPHNMKPRLSMSLSASPSHQALASLAVNAAAGLPPGAAPQSSHPSSEGVVATPLAKTKQTRATDVIIESEPPVGISAATNADGASFGAAELRATWRPPESSSAGLQNYSFGTSSLSKESAIIAASSELLASPVTTRAPTSSPQLVTRDSTPTTTDKALWAAAPPPPPLSPTGSMVMPLQGALRKSPQPQDACGGTASPPSGSASPRPQKTVTIVPPIGPSEQQQQQRSVTPVPAPAKTTLTRTGEELPSRSSVSDPASPSGMRRSLSNASLRSDTSTSTVTEGGKPRLTKPPTTLNQSFGRPGSNRSFSAAEERSKAIKVVPNALHLKNHFVYVDLSAAHEHPNRSREAATESSLAKAADYFDAMRPARQHSPINHIVLLANEPNFEYLRMMWEDEMSGSLTVIKGCGLFLSDLQKCNFSEAAAVVIFSAGERCDDHGDSIAILVLKTIRELVREGRDITAPDIPITVELDHTRYVPLVGSGARTDNGNEAADWVMDPSFLSGSVVCRHILDTALQETYFIPEVHQVVEQMLSGWGDALAVTSLAIHPDWTTYNQAIEYCLARRLLPLALHRLHEDLSHSFRFIITNPPGPFPVVSTDVVYCLKSR